MKKFRRPAPKPVMASHSRIGTAFFQCSLNQLISVSKKYEDIVLVNALRKYGFDALDFKDALFGSVVRDNYLYICVTDGHPIKVNDDWYDPYTILKKSDVTIQDVINYVHKATASQIHRHVSYRELKSDLK